MHHAFKKQLIQEMGRRLRRIRQSRNLSQTELAKRVYKSKQLISAYELGRAEMMATSLAAIAKVLECDLNWIVRGGGLDGVH